MTRSAWILGLYLVLIVARVPAVFADPPFFAEEGQIFFRYAYQHSWHEALSTPHHPYYIFPTLASTTLAANCLPLEYAPYLTLATGTGVLLLLAVLVMLAGSPFDTTRKQLLALLLLLLVPPGFGRLSTIFSDFFLCVGAAIVLISGSGTVGSRWVRRGALALAGLTGVLSVFLTPLFWLKFWRGRSREVLIQGSILGACAAFQILVFAHALLGEEAGHAERFSWLRLDLFAAVVFNQSPVHLFFGTPAMKRVGAFLGPWIGGEHLGARYYLLFALVGLCDVGLLLLVVGRRRVNLGERGFLLLLCYLAVASLSFVSGTTGPLSTKKAMISGHYRYFIAPNAFVALAFLLHAFGEGPVWRTRLYRALVAWLLAIGAFLYVWHTPPFLAGGPSWRGEVARWREDPAYPIRIWPANWRLRLPAERPGGEASGER